MSTSQYPCYYCGKDSHVHCDFQLPPEQWERTEDGFTRMECWRACCLEHAVAEYKTASNPEGIAAKAMDHLCKDHAYAQKDYVK